MCIETVHAIHAFSVPLFLYRVTGSLEPNPGNSSHPWTTGGQHFAGHNRTHIRTLQAIWKLAYSAHLWTGEGSRSTQGKPKKSEAWKEVAEIIGAFGEFT